MKTLGQIKEIILNNAKLGKEDRYEGLDSSEIGKYNGYLMWGEDDKAFPGNEEWARITD